MEMKYIISKVLDHFFLPVSLLGPNLTVVTEKELPTHQANGKKKI